MMGEGGFTITSDRVVMWAVAALLAFNTFQKETVKADGDLKIDISNISGELKAMGAAVGRLETFAQAPRFTSAMFAAEMVPRDGTLARQSEYLESLTLRMDKMSGEILDNRESITEAKFLIMRQEKD